jgi:hypothetical protein
VDGNDLVRTVGGSDLALDLMTELSDTETCAPVEQFGLTRTFTGFAPEAAVTGAEGALTDASI